MADIQTDTVLNVKNTWSWAFENQNTERSIEKIEKVSPYDYFEITHDEAENVVRSFVSVGGVEKWKEKQPLLYKIGAEKEVCLVGGEGEYKDKAYAIKRGSDIGYRIDFPRNEMSREKRALEHNRKGFAPSIIVEANGGPYIVTRYVEGTRPTNEDIENFNETDPCSITDDGNITKHQVVGVVLLDISDYRY